MPITPTKSDEHGVRWCEARSCSQARSISHLNSDANIECKACGYADPKACLPWLWAVMRAHDRFLQKLDASSVCQEVITDLRTLTDIEPVCRELGVLEADDKEE